MATATSARIDENINKYLSLVVNLRAQKNSLLPIFRLPSETLEDIFIHGAWNFHENTARLTSHVPSWVNVSYVCRHWRNVALNCPTLWTYHFTLSLRWTEELLARSEQASLRIRIHSDSWRSSVWWSGLVKKLLDHGDRIEKLDLCVPATILPKLSLRALRLRILQIRVKSEGSHATKWTLMIDSGNIIPLRTLKLTDCPLPWHTLNLSGLTTLFLCHVPAPKENVAELLTVLGRMQGLTVLHLDRALASARDFLRWSAFDAPPRIGLPSLTRLFVSAPLSAVVALLSHVVIPLKTKVRLDFQEEDGSSVEDYARIPPILAQRFTRSQDLLPAIRSLGIRYLPSQSEVTLSASGHDFCNPYWSMEVPQWGSDVPLIVCVGMEQSMRPTDFYRITTDICCSIPSTDIQRLIVVDPPLPLDFWRSLLGHLHGLRHLELCEGRMPHLVSLLSLTTDELAETPWGRTTGTRRHIFVPELRNLELYDIIYAAQGDVLGDIISKASILGALATLNLVRRSPRLNLVQFPPFKLDESDEDTDEGDTDEEDTGEEDMDEEDMDEED